MRAGRLRTRAIVQEVTRTRNSVGETTESWDTLGVRYVEVVPVRAKEIFARRQPQSQVTHMVRMRYWSEVTHEHRLNIDGRILAIAGIYNVDERNREMLLECIEQAS